MPSTWKEIKTYLKRNLNWGIISTLKWFDFSHFTFRNRTFVSKHCITKGILKYI